MSRDRVSEFETALAELERILEALDGEELRLDEALELFERGVGHLREANQLLEVARAGVEELIADSAGDLRTVTVDSSGKDEADPAGMDEPDPPGDDSDGAVSRDA